MKNINYNILFLLMLAIGFTSCELEESLATGILTEPEADAGDGGCSAFDADAIIGVGPYIVTIGGEYQQGDVLWRGATTVASDEMMIPTQGSDWFNDGKFVAYHTHNFVATDRDLTNTYGNLARNIFETSRAIGVFDERGESQLAAQAAIVRAYSKWMMLDNFGVIQEQNMNPCNLNEDPDFFRGVDAVNNLIADLSDAIIANLPDSDYGNPTKATGHALRARVYLNKHIYEGREVASTDMDQVIADADAVTAAGFRLSDINMGEEWFSTNFGIDNEGSPENIWVLANSVGGSVGGIMGALTRPQMAWNQGGWNGMAVVSDFYNTFDSSDPRFSSPGTDQMNNSGDPASPKLDFGFLVGQQTTNDGTDMTDRAGNPLNFTVEVRSVRSAQEYEGPRLIKFEPNQAESVNPGNDFPLLRYADVHLMKAEAEWRNGNNGAAVDMLNALRSSRGYDTEVSSISDRTILDERGYELYNELIRRTDQIRFGTFQDAWSNKDAEADNHTNLFPIPSDFVALYPALTQNPGY